MEGNGLEWNVIEPSRIECNVRRNGMRSWNSLVFIIQTFVLNMIQERRNCIIHVSAKNEPTKNDYFFPL